MRIFLTQEIVKNKWHRENIPNKGILKSKSTVRGLRFCTTITSEICGFRVKSTSNTRSGLGICFSGISLAFFSSSQQPQQQANITVNTCVSCPFSMCSRCWESQYLAFLDSYYQQGSPSKRGLGRKV